MCVFYIYKIIIQFKLIESPNTSFTITNLCICLFIYLCNNDLVLHVHNKQNKKIITKFMQDMQNWSKVFF